MYHSAKNITFKFVNHAFKYDRLCIRIILLVGFHLFLFIYCAIYLF